MAEDSVTLNEGERVLWQGKPEASVLGVWFFTKVIGFTLAVAFITFWGFGFFGAMWAAATEQEFNPLTRAGWAFVFIVPTSAVMALIYCVVLRGTHRYFITNQRLIFAGGLLIQKRRSVHYHKVTDVEVSQNFLEQLLGIRSLKIFTAGTSSIGGGWWERAEISFQGLKEADSAERIVNATLKSYRASAE